jgi:hypothetical protein
MNTKNKHREINIFVNFVAFVVQNDLEARDTRSKGRESASQNQSLNWSGDYFRVFRVFRGSTSQFSPLHSLLGLSWFHPARIGEGIP